MRKAQLPHIVRAFTNAASRSAALPGSFRRWTATALFLGVILALAVPIRAQAADNLLVGSWQGTYQCGSTVTQFTLALSEGRGGLLEGQVQFAEPSAGTRHGAYRVRARISQDGFTLIPSGWIERPPGYSPYAMHGEVHDNGLSIQGALRNCMAIGHPAFSAQRIAPANGVEPTGLQQVGEVPVKAPAPGRLEGDWEGAMSCSKMELPYRLRMLQDGTGLAALATLGWPKGPPKNRDFEDRQAIMTGEAAADGAFSLEITLPMSRFARGGMSGRFAADGRTLTGKVQGIPPNWHCKELRLRRTGPARVAGATQDKGLAGSWAGYDYQVGARQLAGFNGIGWLNGERTFESRLLLRRSDAGLYGRYDLTAPVSKPPAAQDRYSAMLRPLLRLEDGRLALVPVRVERAEGRFSQQRGLRHYVLAVSTSDDGTAIVDRVSDLRRGTQGSQRSELHPTTPAEEAALAAGEAPSVRFPGSIRGRLAAAASLDDQCRLIRDWTKPMTDAHDLAHMQVSQTYTAMQPIYADAAFEALFGIPFSLTTQSERSAVANFAGRLCVARLGDKDLYWALGPLQSQHSFDQMIAVAMNRRESADWMDQARAQVNGLPDTTESLPQLAALEKEAKTRGTELDRSSQEEFAKTLNAKREAIAIVALLEQVRGVPGLAQHPETIPQLAALVDDAAKLPLSSQEEELVRRVTRAKADAIATPLVQADVQEADSAPATRQGLAAVTAAARRIKALAESLGPRLGSSEVLQQARPVFDKRSLLLTDPGIRNDIRAELLAIDSRGDPRSVATQAALVYLEPPEIEEGHGIPFYVEAVREARARLEVTSIELTDMSASSAPGEPSAKDMLLAFKERVDQVDMNLRSTYDRCQARQFGNDPLLAMQCLVILGASDGRSPGVRISRFEKIGCADAGNGNEFRCHYSAGLKISGTMMPGVLDEAVTRGEQTQARFIRTTGGWRYAQME